MQFDLNMVIQSNLSDAIIETQFAPDLVRKRIRVVKILLHKLQKGMTIISEEELDKISDKTSGEAEL